ncbi:MAG: YeeE/YedE family protein [Pseudomonadota bacterium]
METDFTPVASALGGALIGAAAVLLMLYAGRIMGATGILSGALFGPDRDWSLALIAGMATGPLAFLALTGTLPAIDVPVSTLALVGGGFLVGLGVTWGAGCTSGHGVCGLARFSPRSLVAVPVFMLATAITVFVVRHVIGG